MPQMAPMMWLTLMMFFIITLIIMMTLNYFSMQPSPSHTDFSIKTNTISWMW
uniref:ATP synthase complex subunit 8 n=1 Tax=Gryllodes sigillatus TaxID=13551 RepID=A0A7U0M7V5_9ORTH|nr:ATP synthase F0 subunit 8 [Gryllodes sigillatus]QQX28015.1 ATP synthase F0 subunit 8 [Gryllodes sigillatus]QWQ55680.1 ATP synthase F0 subunit 8 [Gryllodes sigillatus]UBU97871.1 ATP synthase F0 subunit 8 [Gryllodes sp.]